MTVLRAVKQQSSAQRLRFALLEVRCYLVCEPGTRATYTGTSTLLCKVRRDASEGCDPCPPGTFMPNGTDRS